jgi:hypothetical protein
MEGSLAGSAAADSGSQSLMDQCRDCFSSEGITLQSSPRKFADWVEKGRSGDFMFVVSTACPAYHYEHLPGTQPRYTYAGLGADIGLAGKRLFRSLDAFHRLLKEGLRIRRFQHQVLVADFEAFNDLGPKRVGMSSAEFRERTLSTTFAYGREGRGRIAPETFSEMCADTGRWRAEHNAMIKRVYDRSFPALLDRTLLQSVGTERRAQFEAYANEPIRDGEELEQVVLRRAAELATAGKLICERFCNALILTISDGGLSRFYGLATDAPVLDLSGFE